MARQRYCGTVDGLASMIAAHATSADWLSYGPKVNHDTCKLHKPLILNLMKAQHNLSFSQKTMADAMQKVVEMKGWSLGADAESYPHVMGSRLRCMLRHVSQGLSKKPIGLSPCWIWMA